jgi:hypothetical protein
MLAHSLDFCGIGTVASDISFFGFYGSLVLGGFPMCVFCVCEIVFVSFVFVDIAVVKMVLLLRAGRLFALCFCDLLG